MAVAVAVAVAVNAAGLKQAARLTLAAFLCLARLAALSPIARQLGGRRQQGAAAFFGATPAGVFGFEFVGQRRVNHQAVVVAQLFTGQNIAPCFDENAAIDFVGFAIGFARVVDPA